TDNGWTLSTPPQDTELSRPDFTQLDASELGITDLTGLEACTSLEELNLALNQISDLTPLSGLTALTWLDLGLGMSLFEGGEAFDPFQTGNLLSDISPLAGLANLEYLSLLGNNALTSIAPVATMASLSELSLGPSPIADFSPLVSRAATLTAVVTVSCNVQDSDIAIFNTLTNLEGLGFIAESSLTDISGLTAINPSIGFALLFAPGVTDVSVVSNYTNLFRQLVIAGTGITALPDLSGLSGVQQLVIFQNAQLSDISGIAGMTGVQFMLANQCQIGDISALQGLTNIEAVDLGSNQITDIQALVDNPGLGGDDYVDIRNNPLSQDAACNQLPALRAKFNDPAGHVASNAVCGDTYTLTINVVGTGTTWPEPGTYPYAQGETAGISAQTIPNSGYAFSHWEGNASGTNPNVQVVMDSDKTVTAVFVTPGDYALTIIKTGPGAANGRIEPLPGVHAVLANRTVELHAVTYPGAYWGGWSGDLTGYSLSTQVFVDSDKTVTGTFASSGYTLTTAVNGNGNLNLWPGSYNLAAGAMVTLQAWGNPGWQFDHWEGDVPPGSENDNPLDVAMDQNRSLTAVFVEGGRVLTISVGGSGSGTTNPAPGTYNYMEGSPACITAIPAPGSAFAGWTGDLGGAPSNQFTICVMMDQDRSITALFEPADWDLTIQLSGNGATFPNPGTYGYVDGIQADVNANLLDGGDAFDHWTGDLPPANDPQNMFQQFIMDQDRTVTAEFVPGDWTLTVSRAGAGAGSTWPNPGAYAYLDGRPAWVSANSEPGGYFAGWTGDASGYNPQLQLTMDADKSVTANFATSGYTLNLSSTGPGFISPSTGSYQLATGAVVTLEAVPFGGAVFDGWTGDIGGADPMDNPIDVTMDQNRAITATFMTEPRVLTIIIEGTGTTDPAGSAAPGTEHIYADGQTAFVQSFYGTDGWAFSHWSGDLGDAGS
ncbi:MAG TPA: hypothetical protein PKL84_09160, partial [Candidatus Hydrogenedentes bacterium]|nr:hypothetical protein [Candidatus Hydrogenedentota bacterium]